MRDRFNRALKSGDNQKMLDEILKYDKENADVIKNDTSKNAELESFWQTVIVYASELDTGDGFSRSSGILRGLFELASLIQAQADADKVNKGPFGGADLHLE